MLDSAIWQTRRHPRARLLLKSMMHDGNIRLDVVGCNGIKLFKKLCLLFWSREV